MKPIQVALTGVGGYGNFYTEWLLHRNITVPIQVAGVVEPYSECIPGCQEYRERGIPIYESLEAFYQEKQADLMIIASPIQFHRKQAIYAVEHGSHVLCEKPTAPTAAEAEKMRQAERRTGKRIFVGFQLSFTEPILSLKKDLLSGRYGKVLAGKCLVLWERDLAYYTRGSGWAGKRRTAQGEEIRDSVASNATAHYLHNLLFLLGTTMDTAMEVAALEAQLRRANRIETFDTCALKMKTDSGVPLLFIASHATCGYLEPVWELRLEKAVIRATENGVPQLQAWDTQGTQICDYGNPKTEEQTGQKLLKTLKWLSGMGKCPECTVETTLPFLHAIDRLFQENRITTFPEEKTVWDELRQRVYISGLYQTLEELYITEKPLLL